MMKNPLTNNSKQSLLNSSSEISPYMYTPHDIDYFLNLIKMSNKNYVIEIIDALYRKSITTLQSLSEELSLVHLTDKIIKLAQQTKAQLNDNNINKVIGDSAKLLLKCKEFFVVKNKAVEILRVIDKREKILNEMK